MLINCYQFLAFILILWNILMMVSPHLRKPQSVDHWLVDYNWSKSTVQWFSQILHMSIWHLGFIDGKCAAFHICNISGNHSTVISNLLNSIRICTNLFILNKTPWRFSPHLKNHRTFEHLYFLICLTYSCAE